MKKQSRIRGAILWVVLFALLIVMILPIAWTVLNAFKSNYDIMNHPFALPKSLDFSNIVGAWKLARFDLYILNTFFVTIATVLITLLVACPTAYAFALLQFKGSNALFYLLFIGLSIPNQAIVISVFYRLKSLGMVNSLVGLVLVLVGLGMPFSIFLMRNTYKDIPKELRESACMDGAGEWGIFLKIFLPLGKAGSMALLVFTFIGTWNEYMYPLVLLISPEKQLISTAIAMFKTAMTTNFGYIFGAAVISMVPSVLVYLIFQRSFIQGATVGAVKG